MYFILLLTLPTFIQTIVQYCVPCCLDKREPGNPMCPVLLYSLFQTRGYEQESGLSKPWVCWFSISILINASFIFLVLVVLISPTCLLLLSRSRKSISPTFPKPVPAFWSLILAQRPQLTRYQDILAKRFMGLHWSDCLLMEFVIAGLVCSSTIAISTLVIAILAHPGHVCLDNAVFDWLFPRI